MIAITDRPVSVRRMEKIEPSVSVSELQQTATQGLTMDSFHPADQNMMRKVDLSGNGDGMVSAEEIAAYQGVLREKIGTLAQKADASPQDLAEAQAIFNEFQSLTPIASYTQAVQGYAQSLAEIAVRVDAMGNGNGSVTQREITTFMGEMAQQAVAAPGTLEGQQAAQLFAGGGALLDVLRMKEEEQNKEVTVDRSKEDRELRLQRLSQPIAV